MKVRSMAALTALPLLALCPGAIAGHPRAVSTEVLGPWTGAQAPLHPANQAPHPIRYYGTDLGFTYEHGGVLHIIFGDTMATESGERIEASSGDRLDDSFGTVDLAPWNDPASLRPGHLPPILLGQNPGTEEMSAIDPGHAMEGFKTPVGGFSNGEDQFGLFYVGKPQACGADGDCPNGLACDPQLGYVGVPSAMDEGPTFGCMDGSFEACHDDTVIGDDGAPVAETGFCVDRGSTIWGAADFGRINGMATWIWIGLRDREQPKIYRHPRKWLTNRFLNVAVRTVNHFDPALGGDPDRQDFTPATGHGGQQRVFLWGRPAFVGVRKKSRSAGLYFAWADMPSGADFRWEPRYFTGTDEQGRPLFSAAEADAAALDLDDTRDGIQPEEPHDIVNQVSIAWVPGLRKWVMFYGGGLGDLPYLPALPTCGILEIFAGPDCLRVETGDGAFRMRTADHPWGPWSPPQDLIAGGYPRIPGSGQYGPGGMLRHAACNAEDCAPHTAARDVNPDEYGFFYSANIIEQWTRPADGGVDLIWNASTWDPYRVILLRTRIVP